MTRAHFDALLGPTGALLVGDPETVAEKILRVNESLGGISRLTFQMSVADVAARETDARDRAAWDAGCSARPNRARVWDGGSAFAEGLQSCFMNCEE